MTLIRPTPIETDRFARNCRALRLTLATPTLDVCTARDGSPTARRNGDWLAGCSVPRRAAEVMVRNSSWTGPTVCLLLPSHGQQIEAVLAKLGPPHGLLVRAGSRDQLADLLACCDVADAATAGRLFVSWDDASLRQVFAEHPGLAVPQQMVRLPDADAAAIAAVTAETRTTLADSAQRVTQRAAAARVSVGQPSDRWCVLATQSFELWNDAGHALARALDVPCLDPQTPTTASAAHLAEAVAESAAVIAADSGRADNPTIARPDRPWVTWITRPCVPAYLAACPQDAVLLADPAFAPLARDAGWPEDRVAFAAWPAAALPTTPSAPLALLADLADTAPPPSVADASSRQVVWEAIVDELTRDPFALGSDPARYVARAPARLKLALTDDFPTRLFLDRCVAPALLLGTVRWLARQGVAFTIHGSGWAGHADLTPLVHDPVRERAAFRTVVAGAGALLDPFATATGHPVRSLGVPLVRTFGRTPQAVLQDCTAARGGRPLSTPERTNPLTRQAVERWTAPTRR